MNKSATCIVSSSTLAFCFTMVLMSFWVGSAYAQSADELTEKCLMAVESGDLDEALALAERVKSLRSLFSTRIISNGQECLRRATGKEWKYFTTTGQFLSDDKADAEEEFIAGAETRKREKSEMLELLQCKLSEARFERDLLINEFRAFSELRSVELQGATIAACSELYASDSNAALLNQVCNEVFTEWGVPNTAFGTDWDQLQAAIRKVDLLLLERLQVQGGRDTASGEAFFPSARCRELLAD